MAASPSGLLGVAEWGAWDGAPVLWKLYVHPDHRGRGLGQHLLRAVIARLPTGSRRLQVEHFAANERAGRFYEREGFEWVRAEPNPADPATAVIWRELDLVSRSPGSSDRSTSSMRR